MPHLIRTMEFEPFAPSFAFIWYCNWETFFAPRVLNLKTIILFLSKRCCHHFKLDCLLE